jgi:hypothetical protein
MPTQNRNNQLISEQWNELIVVVEQQSTEQHMNEQNPFFYLPHKKYHTPHPT